MQKIFTTSLLLLLSTTVFSQAFYAYKNTFTDSRQKFYVFDNGKVRKLEDQGVGNYKYGNGFVVYTDVGRNFKMSFSTSSNIIESVTPSKYDVKAGMFAYLINGNLKVYWYKRFKVIDQFVNTFHLMDSMIYYVDRNNYNKIFYDGGTFQLGLRAVDNYQLGRNIFAYKANNNRFLAFYRGQKILIDEYLPKEYQVGANTIGFIDVNNYLRVFHKGNTYTVSKLAPDYFQVGDDVMAWITPNQSFMAYANKKLTTLLEFEPPKGTYGVKDSLVYFYDVNNQFKVFDQGEIHTVLTYKPNDFKIMNSTLLFTDQYNRLHMYKDGQVTEISDRVVKEFDINWGAIVYWTNQANVMYIYHNGIEIPIDLTI